MFDNKTIQQITGSTAERAEKYGDGLRQAMQKFEINTPARALAFLAQIGHESGGLKYNEEIASGSAYEGRKDLGNTQPGDGKRFKGRGFIQITGRANYTKVSEAMKTDFVANPELLSQPPWAAMASAWWWWNRGLNKDADEMDPSKPISDPNNQAVFKRITKKINGGYNGISDRIERWAAGQAAVASKIAEIIAKNPGKSAFGGVIFIGLLVFAVVAISKNK